MRWIVVVAAVLHVANPPPAQAGKPVPAQRRLKVEIDKSHALDEHRMVVRMSRPAGKVEIVVRDELGEIVANQEHDFSGRPARAPLVVTWEQASDQPVSSIRLKMSDRDGNFIEQEYSAWFVPIPHDEVNFRTDSAEIDADEMPKLEAAFAKVQEVLAKDRAREHKNLTLYVAGHTDTVGNAGYNLKLSRARAESLARWFRRRGVRIPVAFEGFGETALRVQTADQSDEPRNRRADYIIADEAPPMKGTSFRPGWKRVN
jgi:outer membrane protein OmpA-like peptidoglycan-associated protein